MTARITSTGLRVRSRIGACYGRGTGAGKRPAPLALFACEQVGK